MHDYNSIETVYHRTIKLKTINLKVCRDLIAEPGAAGSKVHNPDDVYAILRTIFASLDDDQEHLVMLILSQSNAVTGFKVLASGSMDGSLVDCKVIFRHALLLGARQIILAHNHPSQNKAASNEDRAITRKVADAGKLTDIDLLDHIIVTHHDFVSLRETNPELFHAR